MKWERIPLRDWPKADGPIMNGLRKSAVAVDSPGKVDLFAVTAPGACFYGKFYRNDPCLY